MEYLFIYSLQMANYITILATIFALASIVFIIGVPIFYMYEPDILKKDWKEWIKKTWFTLLVTTIILFALPTKQTLLLMGGTYLGKRAVNEIANSAKLEKINTIIDLQLDKYIKNLKGTNND